MTKTYTIEEWESKRILSKTLFIFMFIENGEFVYSTNTGKYIIYATIKSNYKLNINMTAFEIYSNSTKITIEQNY